MRYVLGVSCYNKETKKLIEGIAIIDKYGMYPNIGSETVIKDFLSEGKKVETIVYDNLDSIQKVISDYSVRFRREGVSKPHQKWYKTKRTFRFYPIKVDSSRFPFKIGEEIPLKKQPIGQEKKHVFELKMR